MKLFKLLNGIKCRVLGSMMVDIKSLHHNDKEVGKDSLFFCLSGEKCDGKDFVLSAIKNGAVAIVLEKEMKGLHGITQVLVKNARKTISLIAASFYGNPAKNLKMIGITGTNGKTSTTYMVSDMLNYLGYHSAIIGTNGVVYNNKKIETGMTTPDPIELQKILSRLKKEGIHYVCMEVSAHSIYYNKLEGLNFDVMIFSNLTEDHLDFFKTMKRYYQTKQSIFSKKYVKCALINIDDNYGRILFDSINVDKRTYSINNEADYKTVIYKMRDYLQVLKICDKEIKTKFLGMFNAYNLTAAVACLHMLDIKSFNLQEAINSIRSIPGRFNTIVIKQKLFVVDYAHTPDGLENVLKLCKELVLNGKLVCVFGCGGNRETQKRPKMGEISEKYADFSIITTDNPRFEDRLKIVKEIEFGFKGKSYKIILDRAEAIKYSNTISKEGDVILIAGKGAENYIDELGEKKYYSDYEEIEKLRN